MMDSGLEDAMRTSILESYLFISGHLGAAGGGISSQGNCLLYFVPWKTGIWAQISPGRCGTERLKSDVVGLSSSAGASGVEVLPG